MITRVGGLMSKSLPRHTGTERAQHASQQLAEDIQKWLNTDVWSENDYLSVKKLISCLLNPQYHDATLRLRILNDPTFLQAEASLDHWLSRILFEAAFDESEATKDLTHYHSTIALKQSLAEHASTIPLQTHFNGCALLRYLLIDSISTEQCKIISQEYQSRLKNKRSATAAAKIQNALSVINDLCLSGSKQKDVGTHTCQSELWNLIRKQRRSLWWNKFQTDQAHWRSLILFEEVSSKIPMSSAVRKLHEEVDPSCV
jgi:hypothetical protein